jgi:hypothetical protein
MADQTSIQESAQALFCAMADFTGASGVEKTFDTKLYPIYSIFKQNWDSKNKTATIKKIFDDHVHAPGVSLTDIETLFQQDVGWYGSSVSIAKYLVLDIQSISSNFNKIKTPKWTDIFYVRGDSDIMKNIESLYKIANKVQEKTGGIVLGDVNKWSPADIYFASEAAKTNIKKLLTDAQKNPITFTKMNSSLNKLIVEGHLLPVSLKKQPGKVHIVKVNFDRKKELEDIQKYGYFGTSDWKKYTLATPQTRDMKIFYDGSSKKNHIKIRHDASGNKLTTEVVTTGALARGGSIGSVGILARLMSTVDSSFATKFEKEYKIGYAEYAKRLKDKDMVALRSKDKNLFDAKRGELSAMLVTNRIFPILMKWLNSDKKQADAFIHIIYQYITSRTEVSGKFIIAK